MGLTHNVERSIERGGGNEAAEVAGTTNVAVFPPIAVASARKLVDTTAPVDQASPHGAQLTNMLFMDRNRSVMEFFPNGWWEYAGIGKYAHHWMADYSGMKHLGAWWDPQVEKECPHPEKDSECFGIYKNGQVGHNETFFTEWARNAINQVKESYDSAGVRISGIKAVYITPLTTDLGLQFLINYLSLDSDDGQAHVDEYVRAFCMYLMGVFFFPSGHSTINLGYLANFEHLHELGGIDFGGVIYCHLLRCLDRASRQTGVVSSPHIGGFVILLEVWFYEYFRIANPILTEYTDERLGSGLGTDLV
ncbi:hypothetical protein IFM89_033290 [Coptis chinensis]|uniref:Aminotransferase-like plant mobile domain-containing protein n=1 Tax=Coptis chinensis TaxID=261450 RepID=A0A835LS94_9MAGN|nr:hypothetical protein IFM89_033290 [Coptis chinensis]